MSRPQLYSIIKLSIVLGLRLIWKQKFNQLHRVVVIPVHVSRTKVIDIGRHRHHRYQLCWTYVTQLLPIRLWGLKMLLVCTVATVGQGLGLLSHAISSMLVACGQALMVSDCFVPGATILEQKVRSRLLQIESKDSAENSKMWPRSFHRHYCNYSITLTILWIFGLGPIRNRYDFEQ